MKSSLFAVMMICMLSVGCMKPYHEEVYAEFTTSEIPFLVELSNDNEQASVDRQEYFRENMVMAKRVVVPHEWKSTGRMPNSGKWVPSMKVIIVDTQPETREWNEGQYAIWVESSDSVGFSTGITITARIETNEDAITFLQNYPPTVTRTVEGKTPFDVYVTSLETVMDHEVRSQVQAVYADEAAKYDMDELRAKKREVMEAVKQQIIPFFEERGITITNIGQFGGFAYENPAIQQSIDAVFQAQQDRQVAIAEAEAAEERKLALQLQGEGEAAEAIEIARGEAQAIREVADAKAYEIEQLQANPEAYFRLKELEIRLEQLQRWNGDVPRFLIMGEDGGTNFDSMLLNPRDYDDDQE